MAATLDQQQTGSSWSFGGVFPSPGYGDSASGQYWTGAWAQSFVPSQTGVLHSIKLSFYKNGSPTGNLRMHIWSDSSDVQPNAHITTADDPVALSSVSSSGNTEITFEFLNSWTELTASTKYWMIIDLVDYSFAEFENCNPNGETSESVDAYSSGHLVISYGWDAEQLSAISWSANNLNEGTSGWDDLYFKEYYDPALTTSTSSSTSTTSTSSSTTSTSSSTTSTSSSTTSTSSSTTSTSSSSSTTSTSSSTSSSSSTTSSTSTTSTSSSTSTTSTSSSSSTSSSTSTTVPYLKFTVKPQSSKSFSTKEQVLNLGVRLVK